MIQIGRCYAYPFLLAIFGNSFAVLGAETKNNLCGVDCVFLIEQNFDVAKGDYSKLLKEIGVVPKAGISLEDISRRLTTKGLECTAIKSKASELWNELKKFNADIIVVAHVLPNHFVMLRKPTKDNKFLVRDPSTPRSTTLEPSAFSGYFLVVSKVPVKIQFASRTFWLVGFAMIAILGVLLAKTTIKSRIGLMKGFGLFFALTIVGCDRPITVAMAPKVKNPIREIPSKMFSTNTLELGRIRTKEPFSIEIPISLPPLNLRSALTFRSSCDCLQTEIIEVDGADIMRINLRTNSTGQKGVSVDCAFKSESGDIHQEQLQISYFVAGDYVLSPIELDFRKVISTIPKVNFVSLSNFDGEQWDASRALTITVADDSGSLIANQDENRLRISIEVADGTPFGHYMGQIRVENESDLIGTATAFWEVVAPE